MYTPLFRLSVIEAGVMECWWDAHWLQIVWAVCHFAVCSNCIKNGVQRGHVCCASCMKNLSYLMYSNKQTNKKEACGAHEYSLYLTEQQQQNLSVVSISIPLELPHESSSLVWYKTIGCRKLLKHRDSINIKQLNRMYLSLSIR